MNKRYITQREIEMQKNKIRYELQDHKLIKDVYPSIEEVEIVYTIKHVSAFG